MKTVKFTCGTCKAAKSCKFWKGTEVCTIYTDRKLVMIDTLIDNVLAVAVGTPDPFLEREDLVANSRLIPNVPLSLLRRWRRIRLFDCGLVTCD